MNITEVKIYRLQDSKTLALVSITIDSEFVVSGLKVLDGQNGLFVAMPSKKNNKENSEKKYYDIAFPITKGARENIQRLVLDKFNSIEGERFTPPNLDNDSKHRQGYEKAPTIDVDEEILPF
jgi:stage V sporulation protein G